MEEQDRCNLNVSLVLERVWLFPELCRWLCYEQESRQADSVLRHSFLKNQCGADGQIACEVVVSLVQLTHVLAAGSLVSAACCCLLEIAMVAGIRRGLTGWEPAEMNRDIVVTFRSHRRFYPASPLRRAFIASSILLAFCIAGLIMVYRIAHGML